MSPSVNISPETFARIKKHAEPLVDTIDTVIARAFDALEKGVAHAAAAVPSGVKLFPPGIAPDLTFATLLSAKIDGVEIKAPNWNKLMDEAIKVGFKHFGSLKELKLHCPGNFADGEKTDVGFHFFPDLGFSVQARDANSVWKATSQLCKDIGVPLEVQFRWADKEHLKYPGEIAKLTQA